MLNFRLDGAILEVQEVLISANRDKVSYWYYDTEKWLKSSHGRQGDTPDRVMTQDDITWVKQHYLPKALQPNEPRVSNSDFDPKAKARYERVTASMEKDNFYAGHTREECAAEWRRRYDAFKAEDTKKSGGPSL